MQETQREQHNSDRGYTVPKRTVSAANHDEIIKEVERRQRLKRRRLYFRMLSVFALLSLLALAVFFGHRYLQHQRLVRSVPVDVRQQVTFPIYITNSSTIQLKQDSFHYSDGVLVFSDAAAEYTFTEQQKTADFALSNFLNKGQNITNAETADSSIGKGLTGKVNEHQILIIETPKTIITVVSLDNASQPLTSLAPLFVKL